ncbi:MAG: Re/Si-specific NAD(P)(+) transhydrogenase subunit alpha [Vicinamibacterales bacterium]|jgi:NAD(P) transhydrogenase subunit alpha|nr:NAD(P)(+) transhydrogenase (Re/Si-specific) subunit alpha [Acidobacteriota bacterium]MDP7294407.1 Re/Si-specific NAD(P)(+) transhydrogenase subunit alpha [Vicinamibacterales bacterium]MDP7471228.1 Re/Si-specific NAD(P)(+) transhydrogenase subunit alpha [Vicinamibacterales bacterium]MDP7672635.1 Re/Si-specific NAD(P)(+) transhydrogenase subunit alpha [Vicinamibacterales bacterium]HJO36981.1 Re/Si-specific NAD(P)(+) transhydrogenase subunit alpha [Vicinamibacterales bacterium]|tara:strand:- start:6057 stop:7232 length:1176 start_codon:yes stop_codon:yes gene_type:complete
MIVGIPKETFPSERRVAIVPSAAPALTKAGLDILIEPTAGDDAGYPDAAFIEKGARLAADRRQVFADADIVLQVRTLGANPEAGVADLELLRQGQALIGLSEPLTALDQAKSLAERGVTAFSLELMPRITRAQSMDVLSSMATVTGYKAVLLAAGTAPRMFPMLMTAAGTLKPARVLILGAGVAGLQAIATARRLGANVEAYDVRPAVKEQVESLGAKFVELDLETEDSEDKGGYAKAQDADFYRRQQEAMGKVIAGADVVVTTALVPGKKAPTLITEAMVDGMASGSVIVDLAAEQGGNCELTKAGRPTVHKGVTLIGPTNLASSVPHHASQMYAKNITTFLLHLVDDGKLALDMEDQITSDTLISHDGAIVNARLHDLLGASDSERTGS